MLWVLLIGCPSKDSGTVPTDSEPVTETGTDTDTDTGTPSTGATGETGTPGGEVVSADCALSATNPLRVECQATLSTEGPLTVELSAPTATTRVFVSDTDAVAHDMVAWGLEPSTTYDWTIGTHTGTVTTGALPPPFSNLDIEVTGTAWGFDAVLVPLTCSGQLYFTMIEPDGDLVWFLGNNVWDSNLRGYEWVQETRSVLSQNASTLAMHHVSGTEQLRLERGVHFDDTLHHDMTWWNGYVYSLYERRVGNLDIDGVYVFDGTTLIGDFRLDDWFTVSGGGGLFNDWSHANGLNATDQGELLMSVLEFDTVVAIDGDPASPTFMDKSWHAVGSPQGLPNADYSPVAGPLEGFSGQHNASRHGDSLWVFDNDGAGNGSRAAKFTMDHVAGTLTLDEAWDTGRNCPIQGGAIPLDGGGALVTCTTTAEIGAFQSGSTAPDWALRASCGGGLQTLPPNRAIPVLIE